jgi:hypothetical protein
MKQQEWLARSLFNKDCEEGVYDRRTSISWKKLSSLELEEYDLAATECARLWTYISNKNTFSMDCAKLVF